MADDTKPMRRFRRPTTAQALDNYKRLEPVVGNSLAALLSKRLLPSTVRLLTSAIKRIERDARKGKRV